MKLIIENFKKIEPSILKICYSGLKFCLVLSLLCAFVLCIYQSVHNIYLFYIGTSVLKSTLFFAAFFVICAFAIDTIKKELEWNIQMKKFGN